MLQHGTNSAVGDAWWGSDEPLGLLPDFEDDYEEGSSFLKGCLALTALFVAAWAALIGVVVLVIRWALP